jgi:hypothetical protein
MAIDPDIFRHTSGLIPKEMGDQTHRWIPHEGELRIVMVRLIVLRDPVDGFEVG